MLVIGSWNLRSQQVWIPELVPSVSHCWWLFTQNDVMTPCFRSFSKRHVVPGHRKSQPTSDPYSEAYTRTDCEPESKYWRSTAHPSSCLNDRDIFSLNKYSLYFKYPLLQENLSSPEDPIDECRSRSFYWNSVRSEPQILFRIDLLNLPKTVLGRTRLTRPVGLLYAYTFACSKHNRGT